MIYFFVGLFIGSFATVLALAMCSAASRYDDEIEREMEQMK